MALKTDGKHDCEVYRSPFGDHSYVTINVINGSTINLE